MATTNQKYSRQTEQMLGLLGEHIRYARKGRHMTVAELAERLGVSRSTVQSLEKGEGRVAIGTYFEACCVLGIELFSQEGGVPVPIQRDHIQHKIALLPARIHKKPIQVNDDF